MIKKFLYYIRRKLIGVKYGLDIEVIGTVAFIRVECGLMPPSKVLEYTKRYAEHFTEEVKKAMGVSHCMFIPYSKG